MKFFFETVKKYRWKTVICILLLAAESICCLYVPFLLGNIIGIGIQCKGITENCPEVIGKSAFALFCTLLPEDESEILKEMYYFSDVSKETDKYKVDGECYRLKSDAEIDTVTEIFQNGVFAAVVFARNGEYSEKYDFDMLLNLFSFDRIKRLINTSDISQEDKEYYFTAAENVDKTIKQQTASLVIPYIYEDAGVDCETVKNEYIKKECVAVFSVLVLQFLLSAVSRYLVGVISSDITKDIKSAVISKAFCFTDEECKDTSKIYRCYDFAEHIGIAVNMAFCSLFGSVFTAVGGGTITFMKSVVFGGFVVGCAILSVFAVFLIYKLTYKRYYRMQDDCVKYSSNFGKILDSLFGIKIINGEKRELSQLSNLSEKIRKNEYFVFSSVFTALSFVGLAVNVLCVAMVLTGGNSFLQSDITLGNIITYVQYALITVSSFLTLGAAAVFVPAAVKMLNETSDFLNASQIDDKYKENTRNIKSIENIRFCDVRLFENSVPVSFELEKGKVLALWGETGVGKTLLTKALLREFTQYSGEIYVNGENIRSLSEDYPAKYVAVARANPMIFSECVRTNMFLAGAEKDDNVLKESLKKAKCDFLEDNGLCLSFETKNGGENLSGGQRSRLAVAGVLAKKADLYIFDDCLISLDFDTRKEILENIRELKKSAAVIIISKDERDLIYADEIFEIGKMRGESRGTGK